MKPVEALAEDFRRVGVALIVAGLIGGFLRERVPEGVAIVSAVLGVVFNIVGYWLHSKEDKQ